MITQLLIASLAWGGLAFGAVYPWAYWPLLAALTALGLWSMAAPSESGQRVNGPLAFALVMVGLVVAVQLLPLPRRLLLVVSPGADSLLREYDTVYATAVLNGERVAHSLSIAPLLTRTGLVCYAALAVFLLGMTRRLDGGRLRRLLPGLTAVGVVIALIGIVQRPLLSGRIYGFWVPEAGPILFTPSGGPFGPFVNRNHFAGWMLMTIPLTVGLFTASLARRADPRTDWRSRLLWLSSRNASETVLLGLAIVIMVASLLMTLSRSGAAGLLIALTILGLAAARRRTVAAPTRGIVLALLVVCSVSVAGMDVLLARYQLIDARLEGRLPAWADAVRIARDFPWTGVGVNTYGEATLFYQSFDRGTQHFAQAHSDYLQVLAEGGLLLGAPVVLAIGVLVRETRRRFREGLDDHFGYWVRLGAVAGLVAVALQEVAEFSLQMPGNAALFALLCGIAVRRSGRSTMTGRGGQKGEVAWAAAS